MFIPKEIIITVINIILSNTTEGRAYLAYWAYFGYNELDMRADVENRIMNMLENIEHHDQVGNDRSYEECYQQLEKIIKDLLAEGTKPLVMTEHRDGKYNTGDRPFTGDCVFNQRDY
jgi:hypothetical protein